MVVERFPPDIGGSGIRFYNIAERLSQNHKIDIFTLGPPNIKDSTRILQVHRFDPNRLPLPTYYGLNRVVSYPISAFFQLLFRSYDVIDVDVWPFLTFFSAKFAKPRTPIIVSWNVVWPFSFHKTIGRISNILAHAILKLNTCNITVSELAKSILVRHLGANPKRIIVVPNGIEQKFSKAKLEPQWGRIIYVGRLEPQKRLDLLLEAFKIIKKKISNAEFHIIGCGSIYPKVMLASKKIKGLTVHSARAYKRDELINQLAKSWLFVSASEFESYGLALAEALSLGLPIVLTQTPYNAACRELVKHEHNGLIVEHNKPEAIAEAIEKLYKDREFWERLSCNAKYATHFYSWDQVAEKIEKVYQKIGKR